MAHIFILAWYTVGSRFIVAVKPFAMPDKSAPQRRPVESIVSPVDYAHILGVSLAERSFVLAHWSNARMSVAGIGSPMPYQLQVGLYKRFHGRAYHLDECRLTMISYFDIDAELSINVIFANASERYYWKMAIITVKLILARSLITGVNKFAPMTCRKALVIMACH